MSEIDTSEIIFYLSSSEELKQIDRENIIILNLISWDDWFTYSTLFSVTYFDSLGTRFRLGSTKIGSKGMKHRTPNFPEKFVEIGEDFFSLGQDISFYENLNNISENFREFVLNALNDLAYNNEIYALYSNEKVVSSSLMRDISKVSLEGQYRRLAQGISQLTTYKFKFVGPKHPKSFSAAMEMFFTVEPKSNPPTNIHVIIGRNGVGKTHLFNNMINSLIIPNSNKFGYFKSDERIKSDFFANLISVSFSVFEDKTPIEEIRSKKEINYSYIGLKTEKDGKIIIKSPTVLKNEFSKSILKCFLTGKKQRWLRAVSVLETDPIFQESEISKIAEVKGVEEIKNYASEVFIKLSSGHKIILLTMTRLVETIEEKSLVILDEPETYLHPPLLSAFIRALSDLLIHRNAVSIIGTHSPVVLQEVPKSCVWKLRRKGFESKAERLEVESFGENVGILTREVFGLEVTNSGFHNILKDLIEKSDNYPEAMSYLENQLGFEGKAILRNLLLDSYEEN